uniref:UF2 component of NDC80 kinetochore complex n=1 Tax=Amphiprion percula TaxID=161767 RepID=A0A3P8TB86_AMPPE
MTENTFPVYTADMIVSFYRTEVLVGQEAKHFTKSDFTPVPKPEAIQTLYMRVLHLLYRCRPEYHSMVSTASDMESLKPACTQKYYVNGTSLEKQKTTTILSAIMNFLQFRKQRMEIMLEKQAKFRADMDKLQAYTRGNLEAEKKIEMLTTIPPEQQAEADELAAALSELQATTMHEYQEVNAENDSIAEWKTKIAEKTQKLAQVKVDVSSLKEDIGRLKSQIVESPEELKSQMEKMRENVKNIKNSIEETDERVVEMQNMVQGETHCEAENQQMYNLLQDLESSMNNAKQRQEKYQELMAQYEKKQKELKNVCIEEGQLKRAQDKKLDKECKQNIRRQKKREMKEQHVQDMHQKREEMADKIQEITGEMQQLKAKIKSLRDVCNEETAIAQVQPQEGASLHKRIDMHIMEAS